MMSQNDPLLIQKLNLQLSYLTQRQALLAQNVANIDTPSYRAHDLQQINFDELIDANSHHLELTTTSGAHINTRQDTSTFADEKDGGGFEKKLLGNNVSLEDQMGKISDVGAQYQLTSSLIKKYNDLYRTAVGKPSA
jgi:flagellar basal-body rod protein FlgB